MVEEFRGAIDNRPDGMSDAVAAIKVLLEMIKRSEGMILASEDICSTVTINHSGMVRTLLSSLFKHFSDVSTH